MTYADIQLKLQNILSQLEIVNDSQVLEELAEKPQAHPEIMTIASDALHYVSELKLRVSQAVSAPICEEI